MTAVCIKTGAHIYATEYGQFFLGDLYRHHETLLLRFVSRAFAPVRGEVLHGVVREVGILFPGNPYGMMVCHENAADLFGYDGKLIAEAIPGFKVPE